MKICIIGTGNMALGILKLLEYKTKIIDIYGRNNEQLLDFKKNSQNKKYYLYKFNLIFNIFNINKYLQNCNNYDLIFYCLPSECLDDKFFNKNSNIIFTCKGIKNNYLFNCTKNHGILFGPSYVNEIFENQYTCFTLATKNKKIKKNIQELFKYSVNCKIYYTKKIIEIELLGIYKNIISLFCGIFDTLQIGKNTISAFIVKILFSLNIKFTNLHHPAGIGDIYLTCSSLKSRNYQFGKYLIINNKINNKLLSEGYQSILNINNNVIITKLKYFLNNFNIMNEKEQIKFLVDIIKN